jgi:hypothetical protein
MALTPEERTELVSYLEENVAQSQRLDALIRGAELRVGRCYFGKAYVYALSLMVMHKAAMLEMASDGVAGPVTSKREGDLSIGFGTGGSSGNNDLSNTVFGQEYLELLEQYSPRPGVTGAVCCGGLDGGDVVQSYL